MRLDRRLSFVVCVWLAIAGVAVAEDAPEKKPAVLDTSRGDQMIAAYFRRETAQLRDACLAEIKTADDWNANKDEYRRQLREMLGLDPLPEKTDLRATITGKLEEAEFAVEKLHFQSQPGLYVTGNLYLPKPGKMAKPGEKYPAILYVCGHGLEKKNGVSYGNKAHYQHHGAWLARNGYVCLTIDTLQMGEIEGIHHGTYQYNRWWWLSRGYTPAGVEAWNCVRALDYLQSRPEVDPEKLGVTGRSGGGAYSWWIAAIDERIKCAVPVAGITDLQNHVVDGCVEGHCDCMYMLNTYRWDYPQVAALVAPRPLMISNTDSDYIFPLDGVVRVFDKARRIYKLLGVEDKIGLNITPGGHKDTQELQVAALRFFNHHLKGSDDPVENYAKKYFEPEHLKVFDKLPADQINTKIDESFVPAAKQRIPESKEAWVKMREGWLKQLKEKSFRGWPENPPPLDVKLVNEREQNGYRRREYEFTSEEGVRLKLYYLASVALEKPSRFVLETVDQQAFERNMSAFESILIAQKESPAGTPEAVTLTAKEIQEWLANGLAVICFGSRGIGETAWDQSPKKQIQNRRRFMLLGENWEGCQVWDTVRAVLAAREIEPLKSAKATLVGESDRAATALLASLYLPEPLVVRALRVGPLDLGGLPINVTKTLSFSALVALAADMHQVVYATVLLESDQEYLKHLPQVLEWPSEQLYLVNLRVAPEIPPP